MKQTKPQLLNALNGQTIFGGRTALRNGGPGSGPHKRELDDIHEMHFGNGSTGDDSGYSSNGKWVSPKRTRSAMETAHDIGSGGEREDALDQLAKEHLGHSSMQSALKDQSGAYNTNRKWLSVSKHAEAIKDAYDSGRDGADSDS